MIVLTLLTNDHTADTGDTNDRVDTSCVDNEDTNGGIGIALEDTSDGADIGDINGAADLYDGGADLMLEDVVLMMSWS